MATLIHAVPGDGWTFSLQRRAATPAGGESANLGAAPMADLGTRGGVRRLAARASPNERFWVGVTAPRSVTVEARLGDGRLLTDEPLGSEEDEEIAHIFARIEVKEAPGLDPADAGTIHLKIGEVHLEVTLIDAPRFDAAHGPGAAVGPNSVYGFWRLP